MRQGIIGTALLVAMGVAGAWAQEDASAPPIEVKREDPGQGKKPTLVFLRENRDFLRAQLDLLRQILKQRDGQVQMLDERHLMFKDMLDAILAAQDTVSVERARVEQWTLLESVRQLGDLEAQLDLMESLLDEQQGRLTRLEADFVGRQQTALVILLRGAPRDGPTAIVLQENGEAPLRVILSEQERASLAAGGIAQIFHELVEPRDLDLMVSWEGDGWDDRPAQRMRLQPPRDRLTFLELDLAQWSPQTDAWTSTWVK